jgi:hypothetical protein
MCKKVHFLGFQRDKYRGKVAPQAEYPFPGVKVSTERHVARSYKKAVNFMLFRAFSLNREKG